MGFEIQKGRALPKRGGGPHCKYPFDKMEVGDMFEVSISTDINASDALRERNKLAGSATSAGATHNMKFTVRLIREDGKTYFGVWRIK